MENKEKLTFKQRFDNFWYYYKWHTLVALFLIFSITICTLQFCSKTEYDIHIMYAGPHEFGRTAKDGDIAEYARALKSLNQVVSDYDGNENIAVDFQDLFLLTNEEIKEAEKDKENTVNYMLIQENQKKFSNNKMYGNYYICILSESVYRENKFAKTQDGDYSLFANIEQYIEKSDGNSHVNLLDECAAYLSSTYLGSLPVFSNLPEDTVVCLRAKSAFASHLGKEETETAYKNSEDAFKRILNKN